MGAGQQALLCITSAPPGAPATGNIIVMMPADVEPTNGDAPHAFTTTGVPTVTTPAGVHVRCYDCSATEINITLPTPSATLSILMRVNLTTIVNGSRIIRFNGGGTVDHLDVQVLTGGGLRVVRNLSTVLAGPTSGIITTGAHFWYAFTAVIDDTVGSFTCNAYDDSGTLLTTGGDALTASGVDTRDGGATANVTNILGPDNGLDAFVDNIVIDIAGELYERCRIEIVAPTGDGALVDLTPSGGGSDFQQVDEVPCGTADYLESTGADQYQTFTFPPVGIGGTPLAAGVFAANVAASGTPQFNYLARSGGTNHEHSLLHTSSSTNKFTGGFFRNNPDTTNAWATMSEIDNMEWGIRWRAANGRTHGLYRAVLVQL